MTQSTIDNVGIMPTSFVFFFSEAVLTKPFTSLIIITISNTSGSSVVEVTHYSSILYCFVHALPKKSLLVLYTPILLLVDISDDEVVVQHDDTGIHGAGSNLAEAESDFCDALEDQYLFLKSREKELGKGLKQTLAVLNNIVYERKR